MVKRVWQTDRWTEPFVTDFVCLVTELGHEMIYALFGEFSVFLKQLTDDCSVGRHRPNRANIAHPLFFRWLTLDLQLPKAVSRWIRVLCVFNYIYHTSVVVPFPIFWYLLPLSRRIWQQVLIVYISANSTAGATWWREYSEVKVLVRRSKLTISLWIKYESPKLCSHWIYHIEPSKF